MMKLHKKYILLLASFFFFVSKLSGQAISIGNKAISANEVEQTFRRLLLADSVKKENSRAFLQKYVDYKLVIHAAEQAGLHTTEEFKEELNAYRHTLATPFLTDKNLLDKLVTEAYQRMSEEVRIAQIFIPLQPNASAADTLAAFEQILKIRGRIGKGEAFEQLAKEFSKDAKSAVKGGDLGFIAVLDNHYLIESAAYNTPVNEVSLPIRTDRGYHLIKVLEKRPFRGKVKLAHILVSQNASMTEAQKTAAKRKIDEAYSYLTKGEPFEGVCRTYSDDVNTRNKGGVLSRWYEAGTLIDDKITEQVFALKEKGDYTQPIQTALGWHIFRLVEKKNLLKFEELAPFIRQKINADAIRGSIARGALVKKLQEENHFVETPSAKTEAISNFYKDRLGQEAYLQTTLFSIENQQYTIASFYDFVTKQHRQLAKLGIPDSKSVNDWYNSFVEAQNIAFEESHLEQKNQEFATSVQEYREGILYKDLYDKHVLQPSLDSTAQVNFFKQNAANYQYSNRIWAKYIIADKRETLDQAKGMLQKPPYLMNRAFPNIYFEKDKSTVSADAQTLLYELSLIMIKNRDYTVEITGNIDPEEKEEVSAERARLVVNYLINKGISATRIIEKDESKYKPVSKTDRNKNMRVGIRFYSNSMEDVVKRFNALKRNSLEAGEGYFKKGENEWVDVLNWSVGEQTFEMNGKILWVNVQKTEEARAKTFVEARGQVINDYQKMLYESWLKQLNSRYPVKVNESELMNILD